MTSDEALAWADKHNELEAYPEVTEAGERAAFALAAEVRRLRQRHAEAVEQAAERAFRSVFASIDAAARSGVPMAEVDAAWAYYRAENLASEAKARLT